MILPGDVIGFSGKGLVSDAINLVTLGIPRWGLSHVGIVAIYKGNLVIFESTTLDDEACYITGKQCAGVQAHELFHRVDLYDGRVSHYPLNRPLIGLESVRLTCFLMSFLGKSYDTIGAVRSGGVAFSYVESWLRPSNMESIFCSELVASAHKHLGRFCPRNEISYNPNKLIRAERREGVLKTCTRLR